MPRSMICALTLVFLLTGCVTLPKPPEMVTRGDYSPVKQYVSELIQEKLKKDDVAGLSIALVDDQRIIWAKGFGYADENKKIPASPETIYRAGSMSELFTAAAIMQLQERGKLDIDRPLKTYLPEFSIKSRFPGSGPITSRNIMTHHSGLPSAILKGMWANDPEPFENIIGQIRNEYVSSPPNHIFSFSDLGYTLLGCVIERVTDRSYASYMNTEIFSPLGMRHTSFSQRPDTSSSASRAYRKGEEVKEPALRDLSAAGLNTTVLDLSRFIEMIFAEGRNGKQQVIEPGTLSEMLRPQNAGIPLDLDFRIGLGWMLGGTDIHNAGTVASQAGATFCYHSILIILPRQKLGVVVLANSTSSGMLVSEAAAEALKLAFEAKTGINQPDRKKDLPERSLLPAKQLRSYAGYYDTPVGVAAVEAKADYLQVQAVNETARLIPRADRRFYLQYKFLELIPINIGELGHIGISRVTIDGKDILEADVNGRELPVGVKIPPVPLSAKWLQRTGDYHCLNCENDPITFDNVHLRHKDGLLLLDYTLRPVLDKQITIALQPISDSDALIYGQGSGRGETIRLLHQGGRDLFWYAGYKFAKKK